MLKRNKMPKTRPKVLLVHLARRSKVIPLINLMPMGMLSLAKTLNSNGIPTKIIHENLEKKLKKTFSLSRYIEINQIKICCFSLHWHQQASRVISMAQKLKAKNPNIKIILGGFTASRFAQEILQNHPEIDFIIKGDAEKPLLFLCQKILAKKTTFSKIPNLIYKQGKRVVESKDKYQSIGQEINKTSFSDFNLLRNHDSYLRLRMNETNLNKEKSIYFSAGRGCSGHCVYCAGAKLPQKIYSNRAQVVFFPHEYVIHQLKGFIKHGIKYWNSCFDPEPKSNYYLELFPKIRQAKIKINHHFDCFGLPTKQFALEFKKTFGPDSALNISPETGADNLRNRIKSFSYNNKQLLDILNYLKQINLNCSLYFSTGLPHETSADLLQTIKFIHIVRNKYSKVKIFVGIIDLEPGSTLFENQQAFKIKSKIQNFEDLLKAQKRTYEVNYSTANFSRKQIEKNCQLLRIEAACKKPQSHFHKSLQNQFHKNKTIPKDIFSAAKKSCSSCRYFKNCYQ